MDSLTDTIFVLVVVGAVTGAALVLCACIVRVCARYLEKREPPRRDWVQTGYGGRVDGVDLATQIHIHKLIEEEKQRRRFIREAGWEEVNA